VVNEVLDLLLAVGYGQVANGDPALPSPPLLSKAARTLCSSAGCGTDLWSVQPAAQPTLRDSDEARPQRARSSFGMLAWQSRMRDAPTQLNLPQQAERCGMGWRPASGEAKVRSASFTASNLNSLVNCLCFRISHLDLSVWFYHPHHRGVHKTGAGPSAGT